MRADDTYTRRPDLYDVEHAGDTFHGELAFYRALALQMGSPVLELGFGTGRVGLEIARAGVEITGIDRSSAMLEAARAKLAQEAPAVRSRVTLAEGDMAHFDLGRKFRLVYVPFRAFLHLHEQERQRACLRRVAAHLEPGGRFAGNFFKPKPSLLEASPHERIEFTRKLDDGRTLVRSHWCHNVDVHEQRKEMYLHTKLYAANGQLVESRIDPLNLTWINGREWRLLLEVEGFALERLDGGFDGERVEDGWEYVWVARRKH